MVFAVFAATVVAAASEPVPLAAVGFRAAPAQQPLAESLASTLALRMVETRLVTVTTPADVGAVLGLERQRALLGCSENSCIAELAGALGAKGLVTGELALVGDVYQLAVKVLDATTAAPLFQALERHRDAAALLSAVDRLALLAATEVGARFGVVPPRANPLPLVGLVVGGVVAAGGGVLLGLAAGDDAALRAKAPTSYADALLVKQAGELKQGLGLGLVATGGAVLVGSLLWRLLGGAEAPKVALAPAPGGLGVWGTF